MHIQKKVDRDTKIRLSMGVNVARTHRQIQLALPNGHLFRNLLESVNECTAAFDKQNRLIYANPIFYRLTGYTPEECLGKYCYHFFLKSDREKIEAETAKRQYGIASKYELTLVTKSKKQIPVLASGSSLEGGGSIGILTDLTKMYAYERRLAMILEHSADAIISIDTNRCVLSWNKGAEHLFGYAEKEILGESIICIIPQEHMEQDEIGKMRKETTKKGFLKNFETIRKTKDGRQIQVSISQELERDENGKIIGYIAIYRDLSESKKWEMELQSRFDKMQHAYMEMGRQRRYLDFFEELIDMAFNKKKSADMLIYLVNAFAMISQVDAVTLRRYRKKQDNLELVATMGVGDDWLGKKNVSMKNSIFEKTYKTKQPARILDLWSEPHYHTPVLARKYNFRAVLLYPLFAGDKYMGNISLYLSAKSPIALLDNEFIGIFAKETALVLEYLDMV